MKILLLVILAVGSVVGQDNLPPNFLGDHPREVMERLRNELTKDEFETNAQYQDRLSKLWAKASINGHSLKDSTFVFQPSCAYEAESQTFDCSVYFGTGQSVVKTPGDLTNRPQSVYPQIKLSDSKLLSWILIIPAEKARAIKKDLRLSIVGEPLSVNAAEIVLRPSSAYFFNGSTGEIYVKWSKRSRTDYILPKLEIIP